MPEFSKRSVDRLNTCHSELMILFTEVVKVYDCTVLCGHRGRTEQEQAFTTGRSKLHYPRSRHNYMPALAVDVAPYPVLWNKPNTFYHFAGFVKAISYNLGIKIRWGGDWDCDNDLNDQHFADLVHFEIRG